jgi:hypothetical protein
MVQHNVIRREVRRVIEALCALPLRDFYIPDVLDEYADDNLSCDDVEGMREMLRIRVEELLSHFIVGQKGMDLP